MMVTELDELHEYASQLLAAYYVRRVLGLFQFIPSLVLSLTHLLIYCQGTYYFSLALYPLFSHSVLFW